MDESRWDVVAHPLWESLSSQWGLGAREPRSLWTKVPALGWAEAGGTGGGGEAQAGGC